MSVEAVVVGAGVKVKGTVLKVGLEELRTVEGPIRYGARQAGAGERLPCAGDVDSTQR